MGLFRKKPEVIDLRDHVLARQRQLRSMPFEFGFPTRCPACHGRGYIDHIDLSHRIQFEHCVECSLKWQSTEDEVFALNG